MIKNKFSHFKEVSQLYEDPAAKTISILQLFSGFAVVFPKKTYFWTFLDFSLISTAFLMSSSNIFRPNS